MDTWYEDRLAGGPSLGEEFDIAVATLPDGLWRQGPAAVNARIKELIAEHTPAEPIPVQGPGPHFALGSELRIALAPPSEIDAKGNDWARIGNLLPVVRQAAGDLAGNLNPNTQPELSRNRRRLPHGHRRRAAKGSPGEPFSGSACGSKTPPPRARREIADRLREPLEDAPQEALDSLSRCMAR